MLSRADLESIELGFSIYDHEWRAYAPVLGEPFLVDGYLTYFDGALISICAYRLGDTTCELSSEALTALLSSATFERGRAVCIWGRFHDPGSAISIPTQTGGTRTLGNVKFTDYDPTDSESVVEMATFDYRHERAAREMNGRVQRSELHTKVVQRRSLGAEHLSLIDSWSADHRVSPYHSALAAAVATYVADPAIHLVEARLADRLVGFGVLAASSERRITFLQNFNAKLSGMPIGDAIYASVLAFASTHGAEYIHMGYSATPSLQAFKRKWGAKMAQPPYREAFFSDDSRLDPLLRNGHYPWQARLLFRASEGTVERPEHHRRTSGHRPGGN